MTASDPDFPVPGADAFDGSLTAMVVVAVVVLVGLALWRLAASRSPSGDAASGPSEPDGPPADPPLSRAQRQRAISERLRELQQQRDEGALTEAEYAERRSALLREL